jgi:hypothetical protein
MSAEPAIARARQSRIKLAANHLLDQLEPPENSNPRLKEAPRPTQRLGTRIPVCRIGPQSAMWDWGLSWAEGPPSFAAMKTMPAF